MPDVRLESAEVDSGRQRVGRPRLAVVASHPIQYQAPWFKTLARLVDIEVLYCHRQDGHGQAAAGFGRSFEWDTPVLEGYRFRWLDNVSKRPGVDVFAGCDTPEIASVLRDGAFDACLVNGWYLKSYVQAIRAAGRLGMPVLVRGDSQLETPRPWTTRSLKYWPYRWLLSKIDAHLYVGRANYAYLRHYGVKEERLFFAPHCVDNERFASGAAEARSNGAAADIRSAMGAAPGDTVFLFAGKFIEKKRPGDFVRAVGSLGDRGLAIRGLMVGSGPLEEALRRQARERRAAVHFLGFQNQTALPACYAAADCLVLPSDGRETWGLVVNEAMACGVPVVVSDAAGCAGDMITEGETGFTHPCGDVPALSERMLRIATSLAEDRRSFSTAVSARVAGYSVERAGAGTVEAMRCAMEDFAGRGLKKPAVIARDVHGV